MVKQSILDTLQEALERYFFSRNGFQLEGRSYDLVMLVESSISYDSYNLIVSSQMLDDQVHYDVVGEMLTSFRRIPDFSVFSLINSLQVLRSTSSFVRQARSMMLLRTTPDQPIQEAQSVEIEGELFNSVLFIRSYLLERLRTDAEVKLIVEDDDGYRRGLPVRIKRLTNEFVLQVEKLPSENWQQQLPHFVEPVPGSADWVSIPLSNIRQVWENTDFR